MRFFISLLIFISTNATFALENFQCKFKNPVDEDGKIYRSIKAVGLKENIYRLFLNEEVLSQETVGESSIDSDLIGAFYFLYLATIELEGNENEEPVPQSEIESVLVIEEDETDSGLIIFLGKNRSTLVTMGVFKTNVKACK